MSKTEKLIFKYKKVNSSSYYNCIYDKSKQCPYNEFFNKNDLKYIKEIILENKLYIPTREELNDPLEGLSIPISIYGLMGGTMYNIRGMTHPQILTAINKYRILSFSKTNNIPQMWAHYANNYNGICFAFSCNNTFSKIRDVEYNHKKSELQMFTSLFEPKVDKLLEKNLFYKSTNWEYEEECRMIFNKLPKYLDFNDNELKYIIIGHNVAYRTQEAIIKLAQMKKIPIYLTVISDLDYTVKIAEISSARIIDGSELITI